VPVRDPLVRPHCPSPPHLTRPPTSVPVRTPVCTPNDARRDTAALLATDTGLVVAAKDVNVTGSLGVLGDVNVEGDVFAPNIVALADDLSSLAADLSTLAEGVTALLEWKDAFSLSSISELYVTQVFSRSCLCVVVDMSLVAAVLP
jgi:hypothetical protein